MTQQRSHDIHLGVAGTTVATAALNLFQYGAGRAQGQSATAVGLGDKDGQVPRISQRLHELCGIRFFPIQFTPVFSGILRAKLYYRVANFGVGVGRSDHPGKIPRGGTVVGRKPGRIGKHRVCHAEYSSLFVHRRDECSDAAWVVQCQVVRGTIF